MCVYEMRVYELFTPGILQTWAVKGLSNTVLHPVSLDNVRVYLAHSYV